MRKSIGVLGLFVGLLTLAGASQAQAQVPGLPYWLWTVPGASDTAAFKTYFACTNNGTVPATIGVQVYSNSGAPINGVVASQLTLNPNETRLFATTGFGAFAQDSVLNTGSFGTGSAQILASVTKRISCGAWIWGSNGMTSLPVIKKYTQKGQ